MYERVRQRAEAAQNRTEDQDEDAEGPMTRDEQSATDREAAEASAPKLSLEELQSRLAEASTSRPTPQYLNEQQQAGGGATEAEGAESSGLPSWLTNSKQVVLPDEDQTEVEAEDEEHEEDDEAEKPEGGAEKKGTAPSGPTLEEAGLSSSLATAARERLGVQRLWAAQAAAIPAILSHRGDVLLSAPTGSGKTLVYALPLLHALQSRVAVRLRAVAILPTRDLAMQVLSVFETLIQGAEMDIKLVACCGRERVAEETAQLGPGCVDVVIGTPGRVVGHMRDTPGFEEQLRGLEWLVIDDADRLLQQSHQEWLPRLMAAVEREPLGSESSATAAAIDEGETLCDWLLRSDVNMRDAELALGWRRGVRKLILSATLTRHPAKLHSLRLHRPMHLHAATADELQGKGGGSRFSLPTTLTERAAVVPPGLKPLALVLELRQHHAPPEGEAQWTAGGAIVFAATVETSHRLTRLLQLFGGLRVAEYSARLRPEERQQALRRLADGTLQVLVCSDVLSRGIDVAGVSLVVNYDAPSCVANALLRILFTTPFSRSDFELIRNAGTRRRTSIASGARRAQAGAASG